MYDYSSICQAPLHFISFHFPQFQLLRKDKIRAKLQKWYTLDLATAVARATSPVKQICSAEIVVTKTTKRPPLSIFTAMTWTPAHAQLQFHCCPCGHHATVIKQYGSQSTNDKPHKIARTHSDIRARIPLARQGRIPNSLTADASWSCLVRLQVPVVGTLRGLYINLKLPMVKKKSSCFFISLGLQGFQRRQLSANSYVVPESLMDWKIAQ